MTDPELCLRERFALDQFRPGQREVIETVLSGRDCLCVMPTGGGKSLCYQLPSLLQDGITLVISPLIALMKDQVDSLVARGIRATLINSTLDAGTQNERIAAAERGEFDLVYVAPERFRSGRFNEAMTKTRIALLAVDEAHCISEWGHDFRPDYTRLGLARKRLGNPPTIALTATATDNVRRDICEQLELADPQIFITGFDRPNLRYEVRYTSGDASKQVALTETLKHIPGAGIIYCSSRKRCEEVADFLRTELRRKCLVYHAGMQGDERRQAQEKFMGDRDTIVAATNAFGMGVDKSDIRFVIHYNIPGTIEAYYQEAGRAGRDGQESLCLLLFAPGDRYIQEFFIESEYPSRDVVGSIYDFLARQPDDPIELTQAQIKERLGLQISEMGVGSSLKLLETAQALERLRPRENMAIIRIDSEVSLVGLLPTNATVQRRVLSALERLVALNRGDETYFAPHDLARRLELEPTQQSRAIHELCEKLPIEFVPPFRGNAVRMLDQKRTIDTLGIDFESLEKRKAREYEKLEKVMQYAQGRQCRRRTILAYFGDDSPVQCGHCDNCHSKQPQAETGTETSERAKEIVRKILSGIARATARARFGFGKRIIAGMLAGKNLKAIRKWGLDKLSTFSLLEEFTEDEVVLLIDNLIAAGLVHQQELERFKPVISVSPLGKEVMLGEKEASCSWRLPASLLKKLRQENTDRAGAKGGRDRSTAASDSFEPHELKPHIPIDRDLLNKLRGARDRWAAEAFLPAYMVLANPVLEELSRVKPTSIENLLTVKGIGPAKAAKYGERLLELLGVPPQATPPGRPVLRRQVPPPEEGAEASPLASHPPSAYYWTWRLLERGFTQSECALIRGIGEETVLEHALLAARKDHRVLLDAFLPSDQIEAIATAIGQSSIEDIESIRRALPEGIRSEHVQLYILNRNAK